MRRTACQGVCAEAERWFEVDPQSKIADPLFVAPEKDDFRLKPDSPALKMGFEPTCPQDGRRVDLRDVGPRDVEF